MTITVPTEPVLVHATAIAIAIDRLAVVLRGPSGAGKSDLAPRLIDGGARLVADEKVELRRTGERVLVTAPAALVGLIEVRGVGILRVEAVAQVMLALLALLVDLVPCAEVDRSPKSAARTCSGSRFRRSLCLHSRLPQRQSCASRFARFQPTRCPL